MSLFSTLSGVALVDTRVRPGTITLPLTSQIPNRYVQFKDIYGTFSNSSLTVSTQAGESFDDGTTSKVYLDPFTFLTLYAASTTKWSQLGGTQTISQTISSLNISSINGGTLVGTTSLQSSITGLGSLGYISSSQLISTVAGLGSGGGSAFTGSTNSLSSGQIFTSSIVGNQLQFITLSSQALYVSSFFTATRQATPMFVTF